MFGADRAILETERLLRVTENVPRVLGKRSAITHLRRRPPAPRPSLRIVCFALGTVCDLGRTLAVRSNEQLITQIP